MAPPPPAIFFLSTIWEPSGTGYMQGKREIDHSWEWKGCCAHLCHSSCRSSHWDTCSCSHHDCWCRFLRFCMACCHTHSRLWKAKTLVPESICMWISSFSKYHLPKSQFKNQIAFDKRFKFCRATLFIIFIIIDKSMIIELPAKRQPLFWFSWPSLRGLPS